MFASGRGFKLVRNMPRHLVAALQAISLTCWAWRSCAAGMASCWRSMRRMPPLCAATGRPSVDSRSPRWQVPGAGIAHASALCESMAWGLTGHDFSLLTLPLGCRWSWHETCLTDAHALQAPRNLSAPSSACVQAAGLQYSNLCVTCTRAGAQRGPLCGLLRGPACAFLSSVAGQQASVM